MTRRHWLLLLALARARAAKPRPAAGRGALRRIAAWFGDAHPDGLKAVVDGREAAIDRVLGPKDGLLLLLVLDLTEDIARIDAARQAAAAAIESLPDHVWTGVLSATDGLRVLQDPGPDRAAAIAAIQSAQVTGRAGLLETIEPAARLAVALARKAPVRVAVLYLTDSEISNYREDFTNPVINYSDTRDLSRRFPDALIREKSARLAATIARSDAPVFAVHLAFRRDRLNEAYQTGLQQILEASGGRAWFCNHLTEIPDAVHAAFQRILSMYSIDIRLPDGLPKSVSVQLSANGGVDYRTRLAAEGWSRE
ncbi:MAG: hypothetical protein N2036_09175 [Bryobacteraceae bacterium]|nr:hypothetical protein [Bryobacteraceae bacterium]